MGSFLVQALVYGRQNERELNYKFDSTQLQWIAQAPEEWSVVWIHLRKVRGIHWSPTPVNEDKGEEKVLYRHS